VVAVWFSLTIPVRVALAGPAESNIEFDHVRTLLRDGRYADAASAARALLESYEASARRDPLAAADVLDVLVESLWRGGKASEPETLALARRAVEIRERALGPEDLSLAQSLSNLATIHFLTGDLTSAQASYERALAIREKRLGQDDVEVARSLNNLANLYNTMGDYGRATSLYDRALAITSNQPQADEKLAVMVLSNLATVRTKKGDYARAVELLNQAVARTQQRLGPDDPAVAGVLVNLASLFLATGDYAKARSGLDQALDIRRKTFGPESPEVAQVLNNLAILWQYMGDFSAARPLYERALEIRLKAFGSGRPHPDTATNMDNLAFLLRLMGNLDEPKPLHERALAIREKVLGPTHPLVATSLNNIGSLLEEAGDPAGARSFFERALAIREKALGAEHPDVAYSLAAIAGQKADTADYAGATTLYERAVSVWERALGPAHPQVALGLSGLAETLLLSGDGHGAFEAALRAEEVGRDHLRLTVRTLAERQALRYASVRSSGLDVAISLAAEGSGADSARRSWDAVIRSRALVLDEMAARHRSIAASEDTEVVHLAEALASARQRLANLTVRGPGQEPPERFRILLDQAREEMERAERDLAERSLAFKRAQVRTKLGLDEVRISLPAGSALVAYARYRRYEKGPTGPAAPTPQAATVSHAGSHRPVAAYLAFVASAGQANPTVVPLGPADRIDALVRQWKEEVAAAPALEIAAHHAERKYRETGEALRRAIWDPVAERLGNPRQIFVVPDGTLNLVSLATLPAGEDRYLVEGRPLIHYLSTERDLVHPVGAEATGRGLLVVGAPDFDSTVPAPQPAAGPPAANAGTPQPSKSGVSATPYRGATAACADLQSLRLKPLPGAQAEAEQVVRLWRQKAAGAGDDPEQVLVLSGRGAGEAAVKRSIAGHRIVHLATHAFLAQGSCPSALASASDRTSAQQAAFEEIRPVTGDNPLLLSGLALAGANWRGASSDTRDGEDGFLTAEEIASLDLTGVEWAVLSACETGLGQLQAGEGVLGLRRAFQTAGARTLIMSLWPVDDQSARDWMKGLYEARLGGSSTVEAVRGATVRMIEARRRAGATTHPFHWGAFVAVGDWR